MRVSLTCLYVKHYQPYTTEMKRGLLSKLVSGILTFQLVELVRNTSIVYRISAGESKKYFFYIYISLLHLPKGVIQFSSSNFNENKKNIFYLSSCP